MKYCAVIATHHKTGTVWMRSIFRDVGKQINIPFLSMKKLRLPKADFHPPLILFNDHSRFKNFPWILRHQKSRIFHVIRDPRDVMISAMNYHRIATERWLHAPRRIFDGMTYQQKTNSLENDTARFLFEMENSTQRIIKDMNNWNYSAKNCLNCRYEDLVSDSEMTLFTKVLTYLGFEESEMDPCRKEIWKHSLFGKKQTDNSKHIRSGESRQWPKVFDRRLGEAFAEKFGDALIKLGYEPDNSWVSKLPD